MKLAKLVIAGATIAIGALGAALSVVGITETRSVASRLGQDLPIAIGRAEAVVDASLQRAKWAVLFIQTTRDRLAEIQEMVDEFSQGTGRLTTLLDRLDVDVIERLTRAEEFVRSLQSGLQSATSMVLLLESVPFLTPRGAPPVSTDSGNAQSLASDMAVINRTLQLIAEALADIRSEGAADPKQVALLQTALGGVDQQIQDVQLSLEDLSGEFASMEQTLSRARRTSARRIRRIAMFAQVFFVCFAASQIGLAWRGLRTIGESTGLVRRHTTTE